MLLRLSWPPLPSLSPLSPSLPESPVSPLLLHVHRMVRTSYSSYLWVMLWVVLCVMWVMLWVVLRRLQPYLK